MAAKYLGERFDIHTGGVDNIFPHHEDEIAQSEAAFGHPHVNYWVHAQHLLADGAKMAKSSGNVFLLDELISRGFAPLSFRYLCLTIRYRHRMNFTFTSLKAAEKALTNLRHRIWVWKGLPPLDELPPETDEWRQKFWSAVENDLDMPAALAQTWDMVRSGLPGQAKLALLLDYDRIYGINAKGVFLCSQRAARGMIAGAGQGGSGQDGNGQSRGAIVNIGSIAGENAFPNRLGYCGSKAAVHHMTRVMAIEWAGHGIRVNCVAPGYIRTDIVAGMIERGVIDEDGLTGRTPQRRLGEVRDVAAAVVYLAGDAAGSITGAVLTVDGGWDAYGYV
ncbi:MAG: SDR family oxidoreductase, partial [SAR324 cluster bacterium]|nr:SDR family oxidoreductase [SAR324 cluster bacterium]